MGFNYFDIIPFNTSVLKNQLSDYQFPVDKIRRLVASEDIIPIKKGMYVISEKHRTRKISREILANNIYGPSYISMDYALQYYSLIPESVSNISSITTKRSRAFKTSFGEFYYRQTLKKYYCIGIKIEKIYENYSFLIASPEKALCDKIVFTHNLKLFSTKSIFNFLINDLRFEKESLFNLNTFTIEQCIATGIKNKELSLLLKTIKKIQNEHT